MIKTQCVQCSKPIPGTQEHYELFGNYCRKCDAKDWNAGWKSYPTMIVKAQIRSYKFKYKRHAKPKKQKLFQETKVV